MKVPKIPLKAMKAKEVPLDKLEVAMSKELYIAQLKYDGVRLILTVTNGNPMFRTYAGSIVPLPKLEAQVRASKIDNIMADSEITIQGGRVGTRPIVSGMINSAMHGGRINESLLSVNLFDSMYIGDFVTQRCTQPYDERYINTIMFSVQTGFPAAANMPVRNTKEVTELSEQLYNDGYEGLILKPRTHLYTFTRSPKWVKIKETKTADLYCTGTTEGTGKYEGMIGALELEGIVEGKAVTVKAGSGMNDNQRAATPYFYLHRTIEVKYNSVIQDQRTGEWSLFLPRFNGVRIDK